MFFDIGHEMEQTLYSICVYLGALSVVIYNLFNIKYKKQFLSATSKKFIEMIKKKNSRLPADTIAAILEIIFIVAFFYFTAGITNTLFGKCLGTSVNYFGAVYFSPLLLVAWCYITGLDVEKVFDMIAPSYALGLFFSKIGCFFAGCCRGIEWEHGLYNYDIARYEFPIQLIEALNALIVFIILFAIRKKIKKGTGFPLYLILYSSTRFFSEFFRVEPDIFINLKLYHFCCISGIIIGVILYVIALKFSDKISMYFTEKNILRFFLVTKKHSK